MSSATVPRDCHPGGRKDRAASRESAAPRPGSFGRGEEKPRDSFRVSPGDPKGKRGDRPARTTGMRRPPATIPRPASPTRRAPYLAPPLLAFVRGPAALADAAPPSPLPVWLGRRGGTGSLLSAAPLARARTARRRRHRLPPAQRGGRGNQTPPRRRRRRRRPRAAGARGLEGRTTAPPAARGPAREPRGRSNGVGGSGTRAFAPRTRARSEWSYPGGGRWEWRRGTRKRLGQGRPAGLGLRLAGAWRLTLHSGQGREWLWREPIALG